jgi:hypothetical protein
MIVRQQIECHCGYLCEQLIERGRIRGYGDVVTMSAPTEASSSQVAEIVKIPVWTYGFNVGCRGETRLYRLIEIAKAPPSSRPALHSLESQALRPQKPPTSASWTTALIFTSHSLEGLI